MAAKAAQQPGGWAEIEAAVRGVGSAHCDCGPPPEHWSEAPHDSACPVSLGGDYLAALRPIYERHAAELRKVERERDLRREQMARFPFCPDHADKVLGKPCRECEVERHAAELAAARRDLEDPKVHELWHRTGLAQARAELAAAGAREEGLRWALLRGWCCENWRGEELEPEDLPLHSDDCPLAAAPAPAGGLLELIEDLEGECVAAAAVVADQPPDGAGNHLEGRHNGATVEKIKLARRLRECAGLPPREWA
jgi:hypothetical protein